MPCALTASIPLDCRNAMGGIKEVKIKVLPSATILAAQYTLTSGVVAITGASLQGWYTYGIEKETANYTDTLTGNTANGTLFAAQAFNLIINQLTAAKRNEILLLGQNNIQMAIRTKDNTYWLLGYENGLSLVTGAAGSGVAAGDRNGYDIAFEGQEHSTYWHVNMSAATYGTLITA